MDWIAARFECSAEHAWLVLRERLKVDVAAWQKRPGVDGRVQVSEEGVSLVISRTMSYGKGPWAALEKQSRQFILRTGDDTHTAELQIKNTLLVPALNAAGECRLFHDGKEMEAWQVSRLILEPILFRE